VTEAVMSVFNQNYSPLEIIISDDCSSDNTFEIIENLVNLYKGAAQVQLYRNPVNLGTIGNVNKVLEIAKGDFVVMAAGDDISMPHRVDVLVKTWLNLNKSTCSIFTNAVTINNLGKPSGLFYENPRFSSTIDDFIERKTCWVGGFSQGFSKKLYEKYGPMSCKTFQEDGALAFRALLNDGIHYVDESTVYYRRHNDNSYNTEDYSKVKKLYASEIGLAMGRLDDLNRAFELAPEQCRKIKIILKKNILTKYILVKISILIRIYLALKNIKKRIRKFNKNSQC
jgi:glycosyltransferase involved in cell wall biosynthesis